MQLPNLSALHLLMAVRIFYSGGTHMQTKQSQSHLQMRALTEGAVMVALATALGYLKLF